MTDTGISLLPGQIAFALLVAALVAYPLARVLLWRYVLAVERMMRSAPQPAASAVTGPPASTSRPAVSEPANNLLGRLHAAPWQSAAIQTGWAPR
jgi:hypothetical protein